MRRLICISILIILCRPVICFAWNDTGHMTVALVAYRQLSDHQKQQIAAVLKQHPHYQLYLSAQPPQGVNLDEWVFIRAATWPDFVRPSRPGGDEEFKNATITHYHNAPWHYVDIPYVEDPKRSHLDPTTLPSKPQPNAITAFDLNFRQLQSFATKPQDRAVALAWVEHLVGDIHQPLHATTMFSLDHISGDKGGNDDAVRVEGGVINLHAFWDDAAGTSPDYLAIKFNADEIAGSKSCDPANIPEYKTDRTFSSWADESYNDAIAMVYLDGRLKTAPYPLYLSHALDASEVPALPPGYAETARALALQRISLAGHRLADQLKMVFKD